MIGKSKLLPYEKFKEAANAPVEHLFGCHEWCDPSWCYAAEINDARDKIHTAVAAVAPTTTATDGEEVSILSPDEVVNPTECNCSDSSTVSDVNLMSDDSSRFSACSDTSDSEEDIDTYKGNYVEEDKDIHFFRNLVPESIDSLETMVFSTTYLVVLKDKGKTLRAKE